MKKILINLTIAISVAISTIVLYLYFPSYFENIDSKIRDNFFKIRGEINASESIVIVDIDDRSLGELGQWPWSRHKVAKILENLTNAGVGVIGFDIVFAEKDNSSPRGIAALLNMDAQSLADYDEVLSTTIANTPTITGYVFEIDEMAKNPQDIFLTVPAIFIEKNMQVSQLIEPSRAILNIDKLQDAGYSTGFFNAIPDNDGIVRAVPLVMKYKNEIYPSLAFEMFRVYKNIGQVTINYDELGVEALLIEDSKVPVDRYGRLIVNYRGGERKYRYIPAVDIYNDTFDKSWIENKFVLIGTSAPGLLDLRATPYDGRYPGVEVHANVIDNLLTKDFIFKPSWSSAVDLLLILGFTIIMATILSFTGPIASLFVSSLSILTSVLLPYYLFLEYGFIINVIFPLLSVLIVVFLTNLTSYFLESKQKELIKGKFASKVSPEVMEDLLKKVIAVIS